MTAVRSLFLIVWIAFASILAGCDPGWWVYAKNETGEVAYLRVSMVEDTLVFRLPPAFDGTLYSSIGSRTAVVQLLKEDCSLLHTASLPAANAVLVVINEDSTISATSTPQRVGDQPHPDEVRGRCGSTKIP